jgi:uncharacterized membrane protein YfcA
VPEMQDFLATLSGSLVGFSLAFVGGGGSILAVPLLIYVVGVSAPHTAIGTSALAVSVNACANLFPHARVGNVRWREGMTFGCAGVVGAVVGSTLGILIDGQRLLTWFALLMLVVALLMLRRRPACAPQSETVPFLHARLTVAGIGTGVLSGFFGIGGGFMIVPALILASRMSLVAAIGTSLLAVAFFGMATAANYATSQLVDWRVAAEFVCGGIVGGQVGALLASRLCGVLPLSWRLWRMQLQLSIDVMHWESSLRQ